MKTGLFSVFDSQQSKVQSFPVLVQSSCGLFAVMRLDFQTLDVTALKGGWMLRDTPLRLMFPPIFLCHLCTSLLIVASSRQSALAASIAESDGHVT